MTALLTIAEAAAELRISSDSVRRLVAAGKLPAVYIEAGYPVPPVVKGRKLREPEGKTRWLPRDEVARRHWPAGPSITALDP